MAVRNAQAYAAAIRRKLDRVPAAVKTAIAAAQNQNADEMVALAQRLAPARTGALRASIRKVRGDTDLSLKVVAGGKSAFYARFVEFGTRASTAGDEQGFTEKKTLERGVEGQSRRRKAKRSHPGTKAQPFFYPSFRALKKRMKSRVARAATKAVKAAAAGEAAAPVDAGAAP